jgi:hypothetical protein
VISSYSPTLTSLLRARRTLTSLTKDSLALMLVAEKRAYDRNLLTIPGVELEINNVFSIADSSKVHVVHRQAGSTTVAASSAAMKVANVVHFACHGVQDVGDATQSGFCLGDGRLAISDLMELHLKDGFLAFLSACETATGSKEQPDQAMHLAAAMLFTGFKNVIASMWCVIIYFSRTHAETFTGRSQTLMVLISRSGSTMIYSDMKSSMRTLWRVHSTWPYASYGTRVSLPTDGLLSFMWVLESPEGSSEKVWKPKFLLLHGTILIGYIHMFH